MAPQRAARESEFRVGIVGAGDIVTSMHLPTLRATQGVRVAWLADANGSRARQVGRAFGVEGREAPRDPRRLPPADAVLLAIPFGARDAYYAALSQAGCAVYVEKPFARTVAYHRSIAAMFADHMLGVGLQRRSWSPVRTLRALAHDQVFGRLVCVAIGFGGPGIVTGGGYAADAKLAGGGILFENGVHWLDAAVFIADAVEARVLDGQMLAERGFDLHTQAQIQLTSRRGDRVCVELTTSVLAETIGRMEFTFEHARVDCSFGSPVLTVRALDGSAMYGLTPVTAAPETAYQTLHAHWQRFIEGVAGRQSNESSACSTLLTTQLLEALYALPDTAGSVA